MRKHEPAICLRVNDYSETSQVVRMLARESGVVGLLAKGAKRPKSSAGGPLDILAEGRCVFIDKGTEGLGTLVEFAETVSRRQLRADIARLNAALYAVELTGEMLAEHDPHPEVFDLLHNVLARLDEPDVPVRAVVAYCQWRLLRNVGLLGQMRSCIACGGPAAGRDVHFSSSAGGLLCGTCEVTVTEKLPLGASARAALEVLAAAEAGRRAALPDDQARAVGRLLDYHVSYQLGRRLRMARHVID